MTKPCSFGVALGLRLNLVQCKSTSVKKQCGGGASVASAPLVLSASSALLIPDSCLGISTPSAFLFDITSFYTQPTLLTLAPLPSSLWNVCQKCALERRRRVSIIIKLNFNNSQLYCTIWNSSHKSAQSVLSKGRIIHLFPGDL